jgi:hypothetical protein
MQDDERTTYEISHYNQHGYNFTAVRIRTMRAENVERLRDGAVDNKDGYGTADAARRQLARYKGLLARGFVKIYETLCFGTRLDITIEYQHYQPEDGGPRSYCDASIGLGRHYAEITHGHTFLRKLGDRIERARTRREQRDYRSRVGAHTFAKPDEVIAALARMRTSVQVVRDQAGDTWVPTDAKIYRADAA